MKLIAFGLFLILPWVFILTPKSGMEFMQPLMIGTGVGLVLIGVCKLIGEHI